MRTARALLPVGVFVVIAGAVTYVLLDRGMAVGPWLLGALLLAHGWVHLMFLFPAPDPAERAPDEPAYAFVMSNSWLIGPGRLGEARVRVLGAGLIAATFACFLLAALSTVGWLVPAAWWGALVVGASLLSTLLLLVFFSPLFLLGFAINAALALFVLIDVWSPSAVGS